MPYFVVDEDNLTSWLTDENGTLQGDGGERFETTAEATIRAKELARDEPGKTFLVCGSLYSVKVPLGEVIVTAEPLTKSAIDNAG